MAVVTSLTKDMYDTETRNAFLELRAKGWSIKRIAARLKVAPRTLVDWNRQENETIRTLRALELEALQEKILATREQELKTLKDSLDRIQQQIALKDHKYTSLESLYRLASLVRAEIRKVCRTPDFSDPAFTDALAPAAPSAAVSSPNEFAIQNPSPVTPPAPQGAEAAAQVPAQDLPLPNGMTQQSICPPRP